MDSYFSASNISYNNVDQLFGDGSDGGITASSGTINLTRTMYYDSITLSGTAVINTNGFRIHVKNILSLTGTSTIQNIGGAGGNGSGTTAGTAGAVAPGVDYGSGQIGVGGGAGGNGGAGTVGGSSGAVVGYGAAGGVGDHPNGVEVPGDTDCPHPRNIGRDDRAPVSGHCLERDAFQPPA